jgi:uncharacterized membrane protein
MRKIFATIFLINLAIVIAGYFAMPEKVAIHFNFAGNPDVWGSRLTLTLVSALVPIPIFLLFWFGGALTVRLPAAAINLPNKDYWLSETMKPTTRAMFDRMLAEMGSVLFLLWFVMNLMILAANTAKVQTGINPKFLLPALIVFILYSLLWCVKLFRAFRRPAAATPAGAA